MGIHKRQRLLLHRAAAGQRGHHRQHEAQQRREQLMQALPQRRGAYGVMGREGHWWGTMHTMGGSLRAFTFANHPTGPPVYCPKPGSSGCRPMARHWLSLARACRPKRRCADTGCCAAGPASARRSSSVSSPSTTSSSAWPRGGGCGAGRQGRQEVAGQASARGRQAATWQLKAQVGPAHTAHAAVLHRAPPASAPCAEPPGGQTAPGRAGRCDTPRPQRRRSGRRPAQRTARSARPWPAGTTGGRVLQVGRGAGVAAGPSPRAQPSRAAPRAAPAPAGHEPTQHLRRVSRQCVGSQQLQHRLRLVQQAGVAILQLALQRVQLRGGRPARRHARKQRLHHRRRRAQQERAAAHGQVRGQRRVHGQAHGVQRAALRGGHSGSWPAQGTRVICWRCGRSGAAARALPSQQPPCTPAMPLPAAAAAGHGSAPAAACRPGGLRWKPRPPAPAAAPSALAPPRTAQAPGSAPRRPPAAGEGAGGGSQPSSWCHASILGHPGRPAMRGDAAAGKAYRHQLAQALLRHLQHKLCGGAAARHGRQLLKPAV